MTNPFNTSSLSRAAVAGIGMAVGGIVLFIVLWVLLGRAGFDSFPRLIASLCIPPAVMAALIGGYILIVRPSNNHNSQP